MTARVVQKEGEVGYVIGPLDDKWFGEENSPRVHVTGFPAGEGYRADMFNATGERDLFQIYSNLGISHALVFSGVIIIPE